MQKVRLKATEKKSFQVTEAFKTLRSNIQFSGNDIKVVAITSSTPSEGKSYVSLEIAKNFAQVGKRTLLIDCDIRRSVATAKFELDKKPSGLSDFLCGKVNLDDTIYETDVKNFFMLFTGSNAPNPTELLSSERFSQLLEQMKDLFDMIIVDTPPIGSVIDAAIVASRCDGAMLVVGSEMVSRRLVARVQAQLKKSGVKILGVVLNQVNQQKNGYYGYGKYGKYGYGKYGKYGYSKYGYGDDDEGDNQS